ncbi:hypothetical protein [Candidatus Avelusimicrobium alvi]|uniref:hypothetical protein n=1 Tax=Candidatus Avelusimicrobium alvi TaxID=3416221 RepID=UPI003D10A21B
MTHEEQKEGAVCSVNNRTKDDCKCAANGADCINSRFTLSVIAVILSCFTGFFTIPMALAALILSLRAQDLAHENRTPDARRAAWWAGLFGWLTVIIAILPIIAVIFFGGTILAFLTAMLATA